MTVLWAHINADGYVESWGVSCGTDAFLQSLPVGQTAVGRPENVHGHTVSGQRWRLADDVWALEDVDA